MNAYNLLRPAPASEFSMTLHTVKLSGLSGYFQMSVWKIKEVAKNVSGPFTVQTINGFIH